MVLFNFVITTITTITTITIAITSTTHHQDYMTYQGGYKPLNRLAMASSVSPFQKISFETSINFMLDACMMGDVDRLVNPSGRLVVGAAASSGTGMFDLHTPMVYT